MRKKKVDEGIFSSAKKFSDAFFDGLKSNAADKMIKQANKSGVDPEVARMMDSIKKEKDELDDLLDKIANS